MAVRNLRTGGPRRSGSDPASAPVGVVFLVDTSALAKAQIYPSAQLALELLNDAGRLATCLPLMLEAGFSARNAEDHRRTMENVFGPWDKLAPVPELVHIAIDLQRRLFEAAKGRAAGSFDLMVAAHAIHFSDASSSVIVVHYDEDYDHIAIVAPELKARWLVPKGSVP